MAKKCSFVQDESFFDSDGVMPSCLIFRDSILYLYYIGWQKTSIEPYSLTIGVAISRDYGETFSERFIQPIIGKSEENPVFVTTPFVWETSEGFEILFSRGGEWIKKEGGFDPTYKLATAKSKDGFLWNSFSSIHTGVDENSSLARPVQFNGHLITSQRPNMNFRTKGNGYKIVFFNVGNLLEPCSVEWIFRDSVVKDQSYGFPICIDEKTYLLFNGEGFGIDGFYVGQVSW
jgi:hypothetical protein